MCVWLQIKRPVYFTIQLIFATIYGSYYTFWYYSWSHYIISANFFLYLQYFQQIVFNFNKISGSQIDPKKGQVTNLGICNLLICFHKMSLSHIAINIEAKAIRCQEIKSSAKFTIATKCLNQQKKLENFLIVILIHSSDNIAKQIVIQKEQSTPNQFL